MNIPVMPRQLRLAWIVGISIVAGACTAKPPDPRGTTMFEADHLAQSYPFTCIAPPKGEAYTLVNGGFWCAQGDYAFEEAVTAWVKKHPNAKVRRIAKLGEVRNGGPSLILIWLVDGDSCSAFDLAASGVVPAKFFGPAEGDLPLVSDAEWEVLEARLKRVAKR